MKILKAITLFVCLFSMKQQLFAKTSDGVDRDFQSWNVLRISGAISDDWLVSMQNEVRLAEDVSGLDEYIFKLYMHHNFSEKIGLSFGYKYINRPNAGNEHDPWGEVIFPRTYNKWQLSHQVRLEARLYQQISGVLPRVRYLLHWSRQLGDSVMYTYGYGAVRFNLIEKGMGPAYGFEQTRASVGIGYHLGEMTRIEAGYLYRYEIIRNAPNFSDNTISMNLFYTFKRKSKKPLPNDHIL